MISKTWLGIENEINWYHSDGENLPLIHRTILSTKALDFEVYIILVRYVDKYNPFNSSIHKNYLLIDSQIWPSKDWYYIARTLDNSIEIIRKSTRTYQRFSIRIIMFNSTFTTFIFLNRFVWPWFSKTKTFNDDHPLIFLFFFVLILFL